MVGSTTPSLPCKNSKEALYFNVIMENRAHLIHFWIWNGQQQWIKEWPMELLLLLAKVAFQAWSQHFLLHWLDWFHYCTVPTHNVWNSLKKVSLFFICPSPFVNVFIFWSLQFHDFFSLKEIWPFPGIFQPLCCSQRTSQSHSMFIHICKINQVLLIW